MCDVLVLGGGPAGATAAIYAARSGCRVTLLYRDGGALGRAERIENYYGLTGAPTGPQLFEMGLKHAMSLGVRVVNTQILGLGFDEMGLCAETTAGIFHGKALILATGSARKAPNIPGIEAFDGMGVSYCAVCDGFFCRGKEVAVLGAGEYAIHEASVLLPLAARVTLLTDGGPMPALPKGLEVDCRKVAALEGAAVLSQVRFEDGGILPVSRLFVALGTAGTGELARKLGIITDMGRVVVDETMATNVPGLYAAGDCVGGLLQVCKATTDGARAAISAVKYIRSLKDSF